MAKMDHLLAGQLLPTVYCSFDQQIMEEKTTTAEDNFTNYVFTVVVVHFYLL